MCLFLTWTKQQNQWRTVFFSPDIVYYGSDSKTDADSVFQSSECFLSKAMSGVLLVGFLRAFFGQFLSTKPPPAPVALERLLSHPRAAPFSPSSHHNFFERPTEHKQSFLSLLSPSPTRLCRTAASKHARAVHGHMDSGLAPHAYQSKEWLKEHYYAKAVKELHRGHAAGATRVQFCRGAKEKEQNSSVLTALRCSRLDMHPAWLLIHQSQDELLSNDLVVSF